MKFTPQSPLVMFCLFFSITLFFSCSKDSDLMADYVALDPDIGTIAKFVKNDSYLISIIPNSEEDTFEITVNTESGGTENSGSGGTENDASGGTTVNDTYETSSSASITLDVLANDTFNNKEEVVISEISQPDNGEVAINSDNTLTYTPFAVEAIEDTFTYTAEFVKEDGTIGKETATVTVSINPATSGQDKRDGSIIWNSDFNTVQWSKNGDPNNMIWETVGATASVVGNPREGTGAVKLKMESDNKRNELNTDRLWDPVWGQEFWVGFSFKVVTPVPNSRIFMQFRQIGGPVNKSINPLAFRMTGAGKWAIDHATDESWYDYQYSVPEWGGAGTGTEITSGLTYNLNQWHDVVIYMKVNSDGNNRDGDLKIWVDGDVVVNKENTTVIYRRTLDIGTGDVGIVDNAITPKLGPYCGDRARVGEIHYDTYKSWYGTGGTYEDVSPLGLSPDGN